MTDPLKPNPQLLIKIGSLLVHYQEYNSPDGHHLDLSAIESLEKDPDLKEWLKQMTELALLPLKRNP